MASDIEYLLPISIKSFQFASQRPLASAFKIVLNVINLALQIGLLILCIKGLKHCQAKGTVKIFFGDEGRSSGYWWSISEGSLKIL